MEPEKERQQTEFVMLITFEILVETTIALYVALEAEMALIVKQENPLERF